MTKEIEEQNADAAQSSFSMDDLTKNEVLPDVQENAIAAVQAAGDAAAVDAAQVDAPYGVKADGTPKKKRGRKASGDKSSPANAQFNFGKDSTTAPAGETSPSEIPQSSKAAACMASALIETATVALISKDWKLDKDERAANCAAWEGAFDYYGGVNLSPPLLLVGSHMQIIMSRAMRDSETKSRISLAVNWVKLKFKRKNRDERTPEEVGM